MRILVTGAFGWTAKAIVEALKHDQHQVIAFDLPSAELHIDNNAFEAIHHGTIADYDFVMNAAKNVDAIVHLAVATGGGYDTPKIPFDINVRGTANIFEAAKTHGIERVILISSAPFHVDYLGKLHAVNDRLQGQGGDFMYDLTKCLQEDIGEYYSKTFGIHAITLRAGHIVDGHTQLDPNGRDLATINYGRGAWVCRYDLARAIVLALGHSVKGYDAFHIIGAEDAMLRFDMERTETILGFIPKARFEHYPTK